MNMVKFGMYTLHHGY